MLRLDGNFYETPLLALHCLYDLVPVGGFVIFDDIRSHPPVAQAWKDFSEAAGVSEEVMVPIKPDGQKELNYAKIP